MHRVSNGLRRCNIPLIFTFRLDLEDENSDNHGFGNAPPDTLLFLNYFSKFKILQHNRMIC